MSLHIRGGKIVDPARGIDGKIDDIYVENGRIIKSPSREPSRVIDASGRIVMAGAVDMHCHIAGPSINRARRLLEGSTKSSSPWISGESESPVVPSTGETGARYSLLGYTTAVDAAISPAGSRQCYWEFADTPNITKAFLLLLANNELLLDCLDAGEQELARNFAARYVSQTGAFGIKAVNAGGVAHWKREARGVDSLTMPLSGRSTRPCDILEFLATTCDDVGLPHALHIHCAGLGVPGNIETTLETSNILNGRRHHLTHVQFHSYGKDENDGFRSAADQFTEHLATHPELTADVGQVLFGSALTISADQEVENLLWKITGKPWVNLDIELESGCGIVPIEYRPKSRLHSLQWSVGLELLLLSEDPWRLVMSTDHPNGASFLSYPTLIAQLMSHAIRRETLNLAHPDVARTSRLKDLSREYSLYEIAIITRAGPAKILGLDTRGTLGPGADADIAIYDDSENREEMFRRPRYVIQGGEIVVEDGELRTGVASPIIRAAPSSDETADREFDRRFDDISSFRAAQLGPREDELLASEQMATGDLR